MAEAVFGLLGVLVGSAISWMQALWAYKQDVQSEAQYLAIRVVCILDKYIEDCVAVVKDDGLCYGQRTKDGCLEPQVVAPGIPIFPSDVDWKSLDHDLMYKILSLPSDIESGEKSISFIADEVAFPPDYEEFFEERAFQYAQFGLTAYEINQQLRGAYQIPNRDYESWNPVSELEVELDKIKKRREAQAQSMQTFISEREAANE